MDIKDKKTEIRTAYLARRAAIPSEERARRDEQIRRYILSSASFRYAQTVLAYHPRETEIDVLPLLREAMAQGKKIALPRCEEEHTMTYRYVDDLDALTPGMYGIYEPSADAPVFREEAGRASLCLVPGVVFDAHGFRIGYGGGYYDRFLHGYQGSMLGLVYKEFILASVPHGRYDLALPVIATEKGMVQAK